MVTEAGGAAARPEAAVTGIGLVTPLGQRLESFWSSLLGGESGISPVTRFATDDLETHVAGEVQDFEPPGSVPVDGELPRAGLYALSAARSALRDAGLDRNAPDPSRAGICTGTVLGTRAWLEPWMATGLDHPADVPDVSPGTYALDPTLLSRLPAHDTGWTGPNVVVPTACAAGNSALAYATDLIAEERADVMIAGGADQLSHAMYLMFNRFQSLSKDVVRPFDRKRRGLIISEGAGMLVLESREHAAARGATPYGIVAGHGNFGDAHHLTDPHPQGIGAVRSMERALEQAEIAPSQVDWVCAHGTGTPPNDRVESAAIRSVFREALEDTVISSIKSSLGHLQGAASSVEAAACLLAIRDDRVPPNLHYENPDPECDLPLATEFRHERTVRVVLNNAYGFGGNISCVVFTVAGEA